jgi:hypothetical protein
MTCSSQKQLVLKSTTIRRRSRHLLNGNSIDLKTLPRATTVLHHDVEVRGGVCTAPHRRLSAASSGIDAPWKTCGAQRTTYSTSWVSTSEWCDRHRRCAQAPRNLHTAPDLAYIGDQSEGRNTRQGDVLQQPAQHFRGGGYRCLMSVAVLLHACEQLDLGKEFLDFVPWFMRSSAARECYQHLQHSK